MAHYNIYSKEEVAAAEYLTAFIKLLYSRGKSGYEITTMLEIDMDVIGKLMRNTNYIAELTKRNEEYIEKLIKSSPSPDPKDVGMTMHKHHFYFSGYYNKYVRSGDSFLKNVGPWQRKKNFKNAIDYHIGGKKRYTGSDIDVLIGLSPEIKAILTPEAIDFKDRELTPAYKFRIINALSDGHTITHLSEKYNCSHLCIEKVIEEHQLAFPVSAVSLERRVVKAINEGYTLDQLSTRFIHFDTERIKELIKEIRILPLLGE